MRGLVKLCASLADAATDEKRDFDFDAALVDICGYVLSEAMKVSDMLQAQVDEHDIILLYPSLI